MMSRPQFARALSILGHPAVLMPLAVVGSALVQGAPAPAMHAAAAASGAVAVCVGLYSLRQVRAGRWEHVDASVPRERGQLNRFLVLLLFGMAGLLWLMGYPRVLPHGLAIGGGLVFLAMLLQRWLKVSLHAAFGAFAVALVWPSPPGVLVLSLLVAGVAWSRLVLRRHSPAEVLLGLLLGGAAGFVFHALAA